MNLIKSTFISALFVGLITGCGGTSQQGTTTEESELPEKQTSESMEKWQEEHQLYMVSYADSVNKDLVEDTFTGSARRQTAGQIGDVSVTVNYGSPGTRGRVIWNGLVSYDQVWVSGSHWATAVTCSEPVMVGNQEVPAGMHAFFTIPGRQQWELILNKEFDQHLAEEYDENLNVASMSVVPEQLEEPVKRLTYEVTAIDETQGAIAMSWDSIRVEMPFTVK